jgi:electron transfer flavoprotein beta subunit
VKQVSDARTVHIESVTGEAKTTGDPVMNPADTIAVSASIDLREITSGEATVVTCGPKSARDVVLDALATGADRGIHVVSDDISAVDSSVVANALADAVRDRGFDVLIAGTSAMDFGTGQVGAQIAEALGVPHIANVTAVTTSDSGLTVQRDLDGFPDEIEVQAPVMLVFAESEDGPKRHPSLRGMMQAKRKTIEEVTPSVEITSALTWSAPTAQRSSADRIMIEDEPAGEAAAKLAAWLREHRLVG